ncbi:unnamed protein product [Calypogeia fissa]
MAASMTVGVAAAVSSVVPVRNASSLSSSASFGAPLVNAAPLRSAVAKRNVLVTRAALPEEQSGKTARREMLASLMAAGAVFATAGSSFAASGPGTPGAERTNEKAGQLLKDADDLNANSPPIGPGRVGGDDTGRVAQKGGAGAVESIQGSGEESVERAKKLLGEAKSKMDGMFGSKKTGDISDASDFFNDTAGKMSGKVSSDIQNKVKSDISGTKGSADSLVAEAQKKADSADKEGKGLVGNFVDNLRESFTQ